MTRTYIRAMKMEIIGFFCFRRINNLHKRTRVYRVSLRVVFSSVLFFFFLFCFFCFVHTVARQIAFRETSDDKRQLLTVHIVGIYQDSFNRQKRVFVTPASNYSPVCASPHERPSCMNLINRTTEITIAIRAFKDAEFMKNSIPENITI